MKIEEKENKSIEQPIERTASIHMQNKPENKQIQQNVDQAADIEAIDVKFDAKVASQRGLDKGIKSPVAIKGVRTPIVDPQRNTLDTKQPIAGMSSKANDEKIDEHNDKVDSKGSDSGEKDIKPTNRKCLWFGIWLFVLIIMVTGGILIYGKFVNAKWEEKLSQITTQKQENSQEESNQIENKPEAQASDQIQKSAKASEVLEHDKKQIDKSEQIEKTPDVSENKEKTPASIKENGKTSESSEENPQNTDDNKVENKLDENKDIKHEKNKLKTELKNLEQINELQELFTIEPQEMTSDHLSLKTWKKLGSINLQKMIDDNIIELSSDSVKIHKDFVYDIGSSWGKVFFEFAQGNQDGSLHGLARFVTPRAEIYEGQFNRGKLNGWLRYIDYKAQPDKSNYGIFWYQNSLQEGYLKYEVGKNTPVKANYKKDMSKLGKTVLDAFKSNPLQYNMDL